MICVCRVYEGGGNVYMWDVGLCVLYGLWDMVWCGCVCSVFMVCVMWCGMCVCVCVCVCV
jgi:hypothetical protein